MEILLLDIGGTKCSVALSQNLNNPETLVTADFSHPSKIMDQLAAIGKSLASKAGVEVEKIGISFGGPFDFARQVVKRSVHVAGWEGFSFSHWAMEQFGVPAIADNDANVGALGEYSSFQNKPQSLAYVTISTGIGAGLVVEGTPLRGFHNLAGELGHTVIDPNGPKDELGNAGTLERFCSGYWLQKDYGKPAKELLQDDDFLQQYSKKLAAGLSNLLKIFDPEVLVLGGGISQLGERLENSILKNLPDLNSAGATVLELSRLGNANVLIGARELAINELRT